MNRMLSLVAGLVLATLTTPAWAIQIPVTGDTVAVVGKNGNTISRAGGTATTLALSSKGIPVLFFNLANSFISADAVTGARLVIYLPKVTRTGSFQTQLANTPFQEAPTAVTPFPAPQGVSVLPPVTAANNKGYVVIDNLTATVLFWLDDPSLNRGIALVADSALSATVSSRKGAGAGAAAFLEIDLAPTGDLAPNSVTAALDISGASVSATGAVQGATVTATGALNAGSVTTTGAVNAGSVTSTGIVSGTTVTGTDLFSTTLTTSGAASTGALTTTGNATVGGTLTTTGASSSGGNISTVGGTISTAGQITGGSITANGNINSVGGSISTNSISGFFGGIGDFGRLAVSGNVTIGGSASRLTLNGAAAASTAATIRALTGETGILDLKTNAGTTIGRFVDPTLSSASLFLFNGAGAQPGGGSWANSSDRRLKKNIEPLSGALDRLMALRSVSYEYIDPAAIHQPAGTQIGFIAQEVEPRFPNWVGEGADGMKFLAVKGFESLTVQALRELRAEKDAEIAALKQKVAALEARDVARVTLDAELQARLARLEAASGQPAQVVTASLEQE